MNEELKKKWLQRTAAIVYDRRRDRLEDLHNVLKLMGVEETLHKALPLGTSVHYMRELRSDYEVEWMAEDNVPEQTFGLYPLKEFFSNSNGSINNYSIF